MQTNKAVDKLFTSDKPSEPVEPAFVTDAKLKWNVSPPAGRCAMLFACEGLVLLLGMAI